MTRVSLALLAFGYVALPGCWSPAAAQMAPRVCATRGQAATAANQVAPWSITVSNEGLGCTHERLVGRGDLYQIIQPPQHGQVTQRAAGARTDVTYTPTKGYVGTDSFQLRAPMRNVTMPYMVNVIP